MRVPLTAITFVTTQFQKSPGRCSVAYAQQSALTDSDLLGESEPTVTYARSRRRGRSGWLRSISNLLGRSKQDEASAIVAVVNATKPVGLRNADRASAMHRQHSALIVHEEPVL